MSPHLRVRRYRIPHPARSITLTLFVLLAVGIALALAGAREVLGWLIWGAGVSGVAFTIGILFGIGFRLGAK